MRLAHFAYSQAELAKAEADNRVKAVIGEEADGLSCALGTVWWKRSANWMKYDHKSLAAVYRTAALELLELAPPSESVDLIRASVDTAQSLYSEERPGVRRIDLHDLREE